jgi:uncharacterized protein with HEPN domain
MAHKTLSRNTSLMVYKFGASLHEELPQEFWNTAKEVQRTWNELVQMRNNLTDNFDRLKISGKDNKENRIVYWQNFDKIWKDYLKSEEIKSRLGNDEREFLQTKFETADKEAKKKKTGLRKQFSLDRIYFRHRYSGGGKPISEFQKQNSKGFSFLFPIQKHYEQNRKVDRKSRIGAGVFGVVKDRKPIFQFSFSAIIHREIPEDAIVKSVSWVGKRLKHSGINKKKIHESQRDWSWSIDVAVEVPKQEFLSIEKVRMISLDVGWRKIDENFLRLGAMIDSDGNKFELRCPINHESNAVKDGKLLPSLSEIITLDETIGDLIQSTKDKLTKLGFKNLTKMREGGLFRLSQILAETNENNIALDILDDFKNQYLPLRSRRVRSFDRLNKYRDWLYQNLASWLADNYDVLVWEGSLNLKKMAEDRKDLNKVESQKDKDLEKIRRMSAKYRNFASIYNFRDYLKKAFTKKGKTILDGKTAYSSRTCNECGEIVEKFADVEFVCPNGHNFDRDFNAGQNLLNQFINNYQLEKVGKIEIPNKANCDLTKVVRLQ